MVKKEAPAPVERSTYTLQQYAIMLGLSLGTTVKFMEEGLIPGEKIKNNWIIRKPEVDDWFSRQRVGVKKEEAA